MSGRLVSLINDHLQALYIRNHTARSFKRPCCMVFIIKYILDVVLDDCIINKLLFNFCWSITGVLSNRLKKKPPFFCWSDFFVC